MYFNIIHVPYNELFTCHPSPLNVPVVEDEPSELQIQLLSFRRYVNYIDPVVVVAASEIW